MTMLEQDSDYAFLKRIGRGRLCDLLRDDPRAESVFAALDSGLQHKNRDGSVGRPWAVRQYLKLAERAGIENEVAQNYFVHIGAKSEAEARRAVELVNEAEALEPAEQIREMAARIGQLCDGDPALGLEAVKHVSHALRYHFQPTLPPHANGVADDRPPRDS